MMSKETVLLNSLIDYVNDVKPYHTKFRDISSEIHFSDSFNVSVKDTHLINGYHQNIWTRDDIGGEDLYRLSDAKDYDRTFNLPPAVFPRFTEIIKSGSDQVPVELSIIETTPKIVSQVFDEDKEEITVQYQISIEIDGITSKIYGFRDDSLHLTVDGVLYSGTYTRVDDTVTLDEIKQVVIKYYDGRFDMAEYESMPFDQSLTIQETIDLYFRTHQIKTKILFLKTGRYSIPYHQGTQVKVNGTSREFSVDYTIDHTRGFIQFFAGKHPLDSDQVWIKIFRSDKIFISYMSPFTYSGISDLGYDMYPFDEQQYDTSTVDTYIITIDSTKPNKCTVDFFNATPGKSKGILTVSNVVIDSQHAKDGDVYTVSAIGPWTFSVQKTSPTLGSVKKARFMTQFNDGSITFIIDRNWSNYYITEHEDYYSYLIEQDNNSYLSYESTVFDTWDSSDPSEFYSDLSITSEHGVIVDPLSPLHHSVKFLPLGVVKKSTKNVLLGEREHYVFVLDEVPPKNYYVEIRVDQHDQYNPMVEVSFNEEIKVVKDDGSVIYLQ